MFLTTKSGRKIYMPTPEEDAVITSAAMEDSDSVPLTDEEWQAVRPHVRKGRPPSATPKIPTTIRFDRDVLEAAKASGRGWQTRINDIIRREFLGAQKSLTSS